MTGRELYCLGGKLVLILALASGTRALAAESAAPGSSEGSRRRPSELQLERGRPAPPALSGSGEAARQNALAFIDWASASTVSEREIGREALASARGNADVVAALIDEARRAAVTDHTRALVVLGLLGEMRTDEGEAFFRELVRQPLPEKGTEVEGEILEQTALAQLQAKAVDGLAYRRTKEADAEVRRLAGEHASIIVRAEAISAYLWNRGDTDAARLELAPYVRKGEEIYLDRVRRVSGEGAESFNRKLEAFLRAHPEVLPPAPQRAARSSRPAEAQPRTFHEPPPTP
jgi:hypothetical protein